MTMKYGINVKKNALIVLKNRVYILPNIRHFHIVEVYPDNKTTRTLTPNKQVNTFIYNHLHIFNARLQGLSMRGIVEFFLSVVV